MNRRSFLGGLIGAGVATVVGFDRESRSWVSEAYAASGGSFEHAPFLQGRLLTDAATRQLYAHDEGYMVFKTPGAVLQPASASDVASMVEFCAKRNIPVAARGQGHSSYGQSQTNGGLLIDMRSLAHIEVRDSYVRVGAGATWDKVLDETTKSGLTPPVLTGYIGLSVGGVLSMAGISGMSYNKGFVVDHVLEVTVVTGNGKLVTCSPSSHAHLFQAVLSGQGQCAIILEAKVELVPARSRARDWTLLYSDFRTFFEDMQTLIARNELDMVWGQATWNGREWLYQLLTTSFYDVGAPPNDLHLLRGLRHLGGGVLDGTYVEYHRRVLEQVKAQEAAGLWKNHMHPWYDVFVPASRLEEHVQSSLARLDYARDMGPMGVMLFFPVQRAATRTPLLRLPDEEVSVLFDILGAETKPGVDPELVAYYRERNRAMYDEAVSMGGTLYPIGMMDMSREDWARHYGREWRQFHAAKRHYDSAGILTPGPGIF